MVDVMEDHLNAFKGFLDKYGLSYDALVEEWEKENK